MTPSLIPLHATYKPVLAAHRHGRAGSGSDPPCIHAMLDALASDPARSRAEREELRRLHRDLQGQVISIRPDGGAQHATSAGPAGARHAAPPGHPGARIEDEHATVPSMPRPADRGVLRGLFRKLVEALHPDKVQDDAAKDEVMAALVMLAHEVGLDRRFVSRRQWQLSPGLQLHCGTTVPHHQPGSVRTGHACGIEVWQTQSKCDV